jgi:hypothetical protein
MNSTAKSNVRTGPPTIDPAIVAAWPRLSEEQCLKWKITPASDLAAIHQKHSPEIGREECKRFLGRCATRFQTGCHALLRPPLLKP